jgi:hypothetical protein
MKITSAVVTTVSAGLDAARRIGYPVEVQASFRRHKSEGTPRTVFSSIELLSVLQAALRESQTSEALLSNTLPEDLPRNVTIMRAHA